MYAVLLFVLCVYGCVVVGVCVCVCVWLYVMYEGGWVFACSMVSQILAVLGIVTFVVHHADVFLLVRCLFYPRLYM